MLSNVLIRVQSSKDCCLILDDDEVLCSEYSLGFQNAYTTAKYEIEWNYSKSSVTKVILKAKGAHWMMLADLQIYYY